MNPSGNKKSLQQEVQSLRKNSMSVYLATLSEKGLPHASYAPCLTETSGSMYIFVSQLARHTQNLLANPRASLLFAESEQTTKNIFTRRRLNLNCKATIIGRTDVSREVILDKFEAKFGSIIQLLKSLPDFHLIQFDVIGGSFVKGFGQAYSLKGNDLQILERRSK